MEDHRLKAFCLVVEMKSFSKAAEAKFISQSAMSHLIKNLEDELGVRLLSRQSKSVTTTPAGRLFYSHARKILGQYKEMENDVYRLTKTVKGPLYLGASTTAGIYLLPQVFYNFSKAYPEVKIELSVSNTEAVINLLLEGKIDIGIVEGNLKNPVVCAEAIAEDEIVVIASEDNPLAKKNNVAPQELLSQPFIMPEIGTGIREFIDDFVQEMKYDPNKISVTMSLGNPEVIIQMVQSGLGISFVSKWSAFKAIKEGTVKVIPVTGRKLYRKFYFIGVEKDLSTIVTRAFKDFVKNFRFFLPF